MPLPRGAEPPYRVFVERRASEGGRGLRGARARAALRQAAREGAARRGALDGDLPRPLGHYGKNDSVDVQYRLAGRETVATGLDIISPATDATELAFCRCESTRFSRSSGPCSPSSSSRRRPTRASARSRARSPAQGRQPGVRVGHLRRRRLHARPHGRDHQVDQAGPGHRGDGAPLLRRRVQGAAREILDELAGGGHRERARAARRPAARPRPSGSPTPAASLLDRADRADPRATSTSPSAPPASPRCTPRRRPRRPTCASQGEGRGRRALPDHPALLRQRALLRLRRAGARGRHRRADHPGHHADHELQPDQDDHGHVRGHDPGASSSASWTSAPTTPKRSPSSGVAYATLQCSDLLARGAPGIHFYTLNRSPATRAILAALRAAQPWARAGAAV